MFSQALPKRLNWRADNPASKLGLEGVAPRVVVWTPSEIEHLLKTADSMGLTSIGDAIVIALHTGQRQGDVLELKAERIINGRTRFRQSKTNARGFHTAHTCS